MEQRVTLVLGEDRLEAVRENLIAKSEYFASLFSPNFRDSQNAEHHINYDLDTKTLQTFINWTSECQTSNDSDHRHIKSSLAKFVDRTADFHDLVQLLQLSVLFVSETLIKDLTDIIACFWLTPERSVQLWLLAKELNLKTIRDLALIACMDRLDEVPESVILELSAEDFMSLMGNVHAQARPDLLLHLVLQWQLLNMPSNEKNVNDLRTRYPFTLLAQHLHKPEYTQKFEEQRLKNNIQCVVGHKLAEDNTERACIYCWDGSTFFELVEIRSPPTICNKTIVGRQIVGRGFDIYLVGGEYGIGTGRFETEIWRYSTISKTWYYVTSLPEPRRHMAVAFLNEKLFVIGGVGRHRLKLSTVEAYHIYTGKWSKAADIPEDFTSVPPVFQIGGNLAYHKSNLYTYDPNINSWITSGVQYSHSVSDRGFPMKRMSVQFLMVHDCYVYIVDSNNPDGARIWVVEFVSDRPALHLGDCRTKFNNQVLNGPYLIGFSCTEQRAYVEVLKLSPKLLKTEFVHSENISNLKDLCFDAPIGCFNILHPNSLEEGFNLLNS